MALGFPVVLGYVLGAIPFAYIVGYLFKGIDIRTIGDGNVGASNVFRHVGLLPGIATLAGDMGKGALAVVVARELGSSSVLPLLAGAAAVVGHNWPIMLHFRGGRGATTAIGVLLAFIPIQIAIAIGLASVPFFAARNIKWCGFAIFAPLPLLCWLLNQPLEIVVYSLSLPCLVGLTHFIRTRHLSAEARQETSMFWVASDTTLTAPSGSHDRGR